MLVAAAITITQTGCSPWHAWSHFVTTSTSIQMFTSPLLLPFRVIAGILITPKYRSVVLRIQRRLPMKKRPAGVSRSLALGIAWTGAGAVVTLLTAACMAALVVVAGVPLRPLK
eukprot:FR739511.1.p1 GENE.FR739511.1~~FR739511.1.p1  ORF type:complete len:114 (+),score=10.80 FR739511.1:606-947(+)